MERLGFVETTKDDRDARKALAKLTPAGIELVADADGVVDDTLSRCRTIDDLPAEQRETFGEPLAHLAG